MSGFGRGALTHDELRRFTGDLERYRHGFVPSLIYTVGIKHLAERAGAYWLIDAIALTMHSRRMKKAMRDDPRLASMQFWSLAVDQDRSAVLRCVPDADELAVILDRVPWTDFPLDQISIWSAYDGEHWTLYLPSEH